MSALVIEHLHKTYANGVHALCDIQLSVPPGLYGLLGPNGAGKSTLMRTLATLQTPDSGSIHLDGVDVLANPQHLRQCLGYLPQHIGAYPGVRAGDMLERFAWLKGYTQTRARRQTVAALLAQVNLSDAAARPVSTYSGGMLRRFGIALALIGSPRLLIVDEPTAGLDPAERNRFHRVLADVAAQAVVLLSTHIVEDVENLCPRLTMVAAGKIVLEGTPAALTRPYQGRLWQRVVPRGEELPDHVHAHATPEGTQVIVIADAAPDAHYRAHSPRLDDIYHLALGRLGADEVA